MADPPGVKEAMFLSWWARRLRLETSGPFGDRVWIQRTRRQRWLGGGRLCDDRHLPGSDQHCRPLETRVGKWPCPVRDGGSQIYPATRCTRVGLVSRASVCIAARQSGFGAEISLFPLRSLGLVVRYERSPEDMTRIQCIDHVFAGAGEGLAVVPICWGTIRASLTAGCQTEVPYFRRYSSCPCIRTRWTGYGVHGWWGGWTEAGTYAGQRKFLPTLQCTPVRHREWLTEL